MSKQRDPVLDHPKTAAKYKQVLHDFVLSICKAFDAVDARVLAESRREHDGVIVFADGSGGISFEVAVRFSEMMTKPEVDAHIGALVERHGEAPVEMAGNVPTAMRVAADIAKKRGV